MSTFGLDEEKEVISIEKKKDEKRKAFAVWSVGGEEYMLKLATADICKLEEKWRANLINVIASDIPPLGMMLTVIQAAIKQMHHRISFGDVQAMYDQYLEESGGSQITLYKDVILPILKVSGFFTQKQIEEMEMTIKDADM